MNDISIEGIDNEGRATLKSVLSIGDRDSNVRDSDESLNRGSFLKWKKKSELTKPIPEEKNRISIKGANQYEYKINR